VTVRGSAESCCYCTVATYIYDGWNRLVQVKDGSTIIATYHYDGLHRRVRKVVGSDTTAYYYNTNWQVVCEYKNDVYQHVYIWGLDYIDTPIARIGATGFINYLFDANRHVTALLGDGSNADTVYQFAVELEFQITTEKMSVVPR
jgi:YD repeat-containing protein